MSQVTFGQLIQAAERHFEAAAVDRGQITRAAPTLHELRRMTRTLGRGPRRPGSGRDRDCRRSRTRPMAARSCGPARSAEASH